MTLPSDDAAAATTEPGTAPSHPRPISELVHQWLQAVTKGQVDVFDALVDEKVIDHTAGGGGGVTAFKERARAVHSRFTSLSGSIESLLVSSDSSQIAWQWTLTGVLAARAAQSPSTSSTSSTSSAVTIRGMNIQRIANGRVIEHWSVVDGR